MRLSSPILVASPKKLHYATSTYQIPSTQYAKKAKLFSILSQKTAYIYPRANTLTPNQKQKMKTTLTTSQAAEILKADENASWSRSGAFALIEYIEQIEEDTGNEIELDVVALRCDYSEHESALQAALEYGFEPNPNLGEEEQSEEDKEADALAWLQDQTQVIKFEGGVIIQNF
jgi:hypothetical protein